MKSSNFLEYWKLIQITIETKACRLKGPLYQTQAYDCQFVTCSALWDSTEYEMHNNAIILTTAFWKNGNKKETLPYQMYGIFTSKTLKKQKKNVYF